jgi:hypothetical protein
MQGGAVTPEAEGVAAELATSASPTTAAWQLTAATRRGRLHAHRSEHREDAAAVHTGDAGWIAAVADGAGSAPFSRIGSALAVHAASRDGLAALQRGAALERALHDAASAAQHAMASFAERAGTPGKTLRTTLIVAAAWGDRIGVMHVGDGAAVFLHRDGRASLPTAGHAGEFSGEVAHFLPDDGALAQLQESVYTAPLHDVSGVLLATDGVEDPWYPMTRTAPALFTQLVQGVRDANAMAGGVMQPLRGPVLAATDRAAALGAWLAFEKRGENDDRTLFVATRRDAPWPSSA